MQSLPEPQTAAHALRNWRESVKYMNDPDSGVTQESVEEDANHVRRLAEKEGITLAMLIPDKEERGNLEQHLADHDEQALL
ncbi:MAG TPA: hypothetical protein VG984_02830 [Candidatus Paceibacterota bacterium]|nr:hypothetical protein [Candidatus Paceibacterota bacterium]